METEKRIVKIIGCNESNEFLGECEHGIQFRCFKVPDNVNTNSYILGYVMYDEELDEFYIQSICLSDKNAWEEQEKEYR